MVKQTKVQDGNTIRFGSGMVEVGEDVNSLKNLGAMRDVQFEESWEKVRVMSDNAGEVDAGIRNHRAAVAGSLMEIDLENLNLIRGGIDNYEVEEGELIENHEQTVTEWELNKLILFENQNYDKSEITVASVEGNGTTYTEDEDFKKGQDSDGNWGIWVLDTTTTDTDHNLTITYDYTPPKAKILKSGGKISLDHRVARITNYDEDDNPFSITVYKATAEEGLNIELQGDEEEDPAVVPIRLEGRIDQARDKGEQLFKIRDEQGVM